MSGYTEEEKADYKKYCDEILAINKIKREYEKKWHLKKPKRKRGLKKGEWKGGQK